jgi:hypothetical protein
MLADDERMFQGQHYRQVGVRPHVCRDGRETELAIWRSHCATCGESFEFAAPATSTKFEPNRRCQRCKRPGSWVSRRRRRKHVH